MYYYMAQGLPMWKAVILALKTRTSFQRMFLRPEFWIYIALHVAMITMTRNDTIKLVEFEYRWEVVSAADFFMTFFLTFYTGHCFERYMQMYRACMKVMDSTQFFVVELVTSLNSPEVEKHRINAAKYTLALMEVFFRSTVGPIQKSTFTDLHHKGMITKVEAELLGKCTDFHAPVLILAAWAMQVVDTALEHELFWLYENRPMRVAHTHNRMDVHIKNLLHACFEVFDIQALPIPFALFHMMNWVLIVNLLFLAIYAAAFKTYMTIFPFVGALGFFLGLRDVSTSMADPFTQTEADFPVVAFIQHTFDNVVCLIEAFRTEETSVHAKRVVAVTRSFQQEQLSNYTHEDVFYNHRYNPVEAAVYSWNRETPLQVLVGTHPDPLKVLQRDVVCKADETENRRHSHADAEGLEKWREFLNFGSATTMMLQEGKDAAVAAKAAVRASIRQTTQTTRRFCLCCWRRLGQEPTPGGGATSQKSGYYSLTRRQKMIVEREGLERENLHLKQAIDKLKQEVEALKNEHGLNTPKTTRTTNIRKTEITRLQSTFSVDVERMQSIERFQSGNLGRHSSGDLERHTSGNIVRTKSGNVAARSTTRTMRRGATRDRFSNAEEDDGAGVGSLSLPALEDGLADDDARTLQARGDDDGEVYDEDEEYMEDGEEDDGTAEEPSTLEVMLEALDRVREMAPTNRPTANQELGFEGPTPMNHVSFEEARQRVAHFVTTI